MTDEMRLALAWATTGPVNSTSAEFCRLALVGWQHEQGKRARADWQPRLIGNDPRERLTTAEAAKIAGKTERCIRLWCESFGLGRRITIAGASPWVLSRPLFLCFLDGPAGQVEVRRFNEGEPAGPRLRAHYERLGLVDLLT